MKVYSVLFVLEVVGEVIIISGIDDELLLVKNNVLSVVF